MPAPIAFRTIADARAAAARAGGILRPIPGASVATPAAAAPPPADAVTRQLDGIAAALDAQAKLLARLVPVAPALPPSSAPTPLPAPAPPAATAAVTYAGPLDLQLVRDDRTRQVAAVQVQRPGEPGATVEIAIVRDARARISELRVAGPGSQPAAIVRVERDRASRAPIALHVEPVPVRPA